MTYVALSSYVTAYVIQNISNSMILILSVIKRCKFSFKLAYDSVTGICTTYSRSIWVILGPYSDKLVQVVSAQYGRISRQIVKVVHNNSHKQVQHLQIKNELSNM